ncbi:MAG: PAS domain S-box protein [Bacteroidetes bacterium]|jgi:PAS domain S-box-containing protein|nr:PAS domain S-box protein [Bacteroidota bacterium]
MDKLKTIIKSSPFIIAFIYLIVGALWIQYSDQAVLAMFDDSDTITQIQSFKGWFYVLASSILIYFLVYQSNVLVENLFDDTRKEKDKFEATFQKAPIGIAHHKPDEKWMLVNQTLCNILGYKKDELLQLNFDDFIHPEDLQRGRQLDQDIINGVISSYKDEKRYKRKDGSFLDIQLTKGSVRDKDGDVKYLIAIIEDISRQKKDRAKLRQTLEEKEILLAEVHHRVKNNIALMSALLELQLMHSDSDHLNEVLYHYKTRLKSLSLIYDNFKGVEKEPNIDFKWFLNEQYNYLKHVFDMSETEIEYHKTNRDIELNINQAIPVGLICNEMLIHSYTREFTDIENSFINIQLTSENGRVKLSVENNGKPANGQADINDSQSLDARIMHALVKQINGKVSLTTNDDIEIFELIFEKGVWKGAGSHIQPTS